MKLLFFIIFAFCSINAWATPDCYKNAARPAHELPFLNEQGAASVTAINPDGQTCQEVLLYNGKPVFNQKIYAPLRALYETYAKAIETGNAAAAKRAYAWLRPTPREFPLWLWLYNEPEGALMPWCMNMAIKIMQILQPDADFLKAAQQSRSNPILNMQRAWPLLFLLMGGETLPQHDAEKWHPASGNPEYLLVWRYPWALVEENRQDGTRVYRLR